MLEALSSFVAGIGAVGTGWDLNAAELTAEAVNSFCWTCWRLGRRDALDLLGAWVARHSDAADSLLFAQAMTELECQREERLVELQALRSLRWGSLAHKVNAWEACLEVQWRHLSDAEVATRSLLPSGAAEPHWPRFHFVSRELYRKVARLDADIVQAAARQPLRRPLLAPGALLEAVDAHAQGVGQWLKVAGMEKAALLESGLARRGRPWPEAGRVAVELGAFVGYTSVRLASRIGSLVAATAAVPPALLRSVSLEVDHVHQVVARHLLDLGGLSAQGEVWSGQVRDLAPRVVDELGAWSAGLIFMDHRGTRFHEDLARLVAVRAPGSASDVIADNVLNPGAPVFAWSVCRDKSAAAWLLPEFMSQGREDWMVVIGC